MDDDLESELMDLATNECVYLPQAAHSRPPLPAPAAPAAPATTDGSTTAVRRPFLPASLSRPSYPHASVSAAAISALPAAPTALPLPLPTDDGPLDSGEEPAGWYDQLEMLLASAESRYYDWLSALEMQGSASEEEFRRAEAERLARRLVVVQDLKRVRRAVVHARLVESSNAAPRVDPTVSPVDRMMVSPVDRMMDKLAAVVDDSAKELKAVQRDGLWTKLAENLSPVERDYVAKGADELFTEKLKYKRERDETQTIIEQHVKAVFQLQAPMRNGQSVVRTLVHSLGQTLREFSGIFHDCYGDPAVTAALSVTPNNNVAATRLLSLVAADINAFAGILVQVVLYKYPDLPRAWATPVIHACVIDALFEHLQPTLHGLYVAAFTHENAYVHHLCQQLRSRRLDHFGVSSVFRLDGSWSPTTTERILRDANDLHLHSLRQYESVLARMNALPTNRSPWAKADVIASICRDIDTRVKEHYAQLAASGCPTPSASDVNMTADDLAAVLAFLIASSPALGSHLATQLALLGSYMASEMGEASFAVATLWTAVSHLCHLLKT